MARRGRPPAHQSRFRRGGSGLIGTSRRRGTGPAAAFATLRSAGPVYDVEDAPDAVDRTLPTAAGGSAPSRVAVPRRERLRQDSLLRAVGDLPGPRRFARPDRPAGYLSQEARDLPGELRGVASSITGCGVARGVASYVPARRALRFARVDSVRPAQSAGERRMDAVSLSRWRAAGSADRMGEPNVLLIDEPTNDLDTDTLARWGPLDSWRARGRGSYRSSRAVCDTLSRARLRPARMCRRGADYWLAGPPAPRARGGLLPFARRRPRRRPGARRELARMELRIATRRRASCAAGKRPSTPRHVRVAALDAAPSAGRPAAPSRLR